MRASLQEELTRTPPCAAVHSLPLCRKTALAWWPTPAYAMIIQGRTPGRLLLNESNCGREDFGRAVMVTKFQGIRPREAGWFDPHTAGLPR